MPEVWVRVGQGRDYPIFIESRILNKAGSLIKTRVKGRDAGLLTHPRIYRLYGRVVEKSLKSAGFRVHTFLVPEGENSKSLAEAERLVGRMISAQMDRSSFLVALGGGVIGDLTGFLAAVYMRGIDFVQIPTTLLAQIDSSVGGKVAINHAKGKNLIGAFWQPRMVLTDPLVLKTLPQREVRAGLAEMIKAAIIQDAKFFFELERNMPQIKALKQKAIKAAIARSCEIKARIVQKDEKEAGLRALLNYGHTLGHALETHHHYKNVYLHGEAIAVGMVMAARLAYQDGWCSREVMQRQIDLIEQAQLPVRGKGESVKSILRLMKADKKARNGVSIFVLTPQIGHARIVEKIPPFSVSRTLKAVLGDA